MLPSGNPTPKKENEEFGIKTLLRFIVDNCLLTFIFAYFDKEDIAFLYFKLFNKLLRKRNQVNRISLRGPHLNLYNLRLIAHASTTLDIIRLYIKTLGRKSRKIYIFSREDRE